MSVSGASGCIKKALLSPQVLASLPYTMTLRAASLPSALNVFLRRIFEPEYVTLRVLEAGGGGDCLFHAIGAGLEKMLRDDGPAAHHVLAHLPQEHFTQGKPHLVKTLRTLVAQRFIANSTAEEFLNAVLNFRAQQQQGRAWQDAWDPSHLLCHCGFEFLLGAETVEAVGPNDDGRPEDILVTSRSTGDLQIHALEGGTTKLLNLQAELQEVLQESGNTHWGTVLDVAMLAEALNIGFMVFSSRVQGSDRWLYGLNLQRGYFPFLMMLYCNENVHYAPASRALRFMQWF